MTYNHNRHEILRKVTFSHCHLHSRCRSTPGTGHTSLCNICDKSPWFYCSCSLFAQHSCNVFEKRYIQDLHWDVRPGDDVRFLGWWVPSADFPTCHLAGVTSRVSSGQHHRKLAQNVVRNRQRNLTRPYWTEQYRTEQLCSLLNYIQSFLACNK